MKTKFINEYIISNEFFRVFLEGKANISIMEYLDNSYCDAIGEIDLNVDSYKIIYHVEGKYLMPLVDSSYTNLFNVMKSEVVHPDDVVIYDNLMSPINAFDKFKTSPTPNFRFAHFRNKTLDGQYRWVEQVIITGEENGIKPGVIRFYVFDINNAKLRNQGQTMNDEAELVRHHHDEITGLYKEGAFIKKVENRINERPNEDWAAVSIDIEHFKLFDDWFGRENGNILLSKIGNTILDLMKEYDGLGGYLGQDDFLLLLKNNKEHINNIFEKIRNNITEFNLSSGFMPAIGVCLLKDAKNYIDAFDKASIATYASKNDIKERIHYYDPATHVQSENEYRTLLDSMNALNNGEITFYLQPQIRLSTGKVVGAEALSRWIKKDGTFVSPIEFIPVLEKYGFITDLDKYIWEEVFKWLRKMLDKGIKPVPVSINVSRVDIFTIDIAEFLVSLANKYNVPHNLIKVEITESAYAETSDVVAKLVETLRKEEFMILMDDFGSGYSSLNMLSNLKVDAIKLDALFLNIQASNQSGIRILESVINMAKQIGLPIIVEGIENEKQKNFLEDLGVRYVQGFYYSKAIDVDSFEKWIKDDSKVDRKGFIAKANDQYRIREFLDKNVYSDTMLNNIIGAVAFYSVRNNHVDIVRFNQQFYESVGSKEFSERLVNIEQYCPPEDRPLLFDAFERAKENKLNGANVILRFYLEDGSLTVFSMRLYYLGNRDGAPLYYGSAANITKFAREHDYLTIISNYSDKTMLFVHNNKGKWEYKAIINGLENELGYKVDELENIFNSLARGEKSSDKNYLWVKDVVNAFSSEKRIEIAINGNAKNGKIIPLKLECIPVKAKSQSFENIIVLSKI